ncbi:MULTISPECIES: EAL domain-containing protein [unclassified Modicisalibacter]|uniref:EAL domain-containing protein n=1 Tax=unclassified Modicisalibacter TaxID=2679913 RepID=UPI001CCC7FFB|nr:MULTISPECIES: EAL domain-containing protein [unclassified Modicisalibacter]MBZ9558415.1 EAL domain-containing protein [Modicisalibacter sp. R2A 31.J]MBZ9575693.1 EAL domain-containing protein [Modicisalibacter sp. MOD 31.J]
MPQDLPIERIMQTGLLCCSPRTPLCEAAARMAERCCSSVLVMEGDAVVGIWTEHDSLQVDFDEPGAVRVPIAQVMSYPVVSLPPSTPIGEAAMRFAAENRRHFLVADADGRPLGIVSQSDVVLNQGLEPYLRLREVRAAMRPEPVILDGGLSLRDTASTMQAATCDAVVVRCGDTLGILTERDLVRFVARHPGNTAIRELASRPLMSVRADDMLIHARDLLIGHHVRHLVVLDEDDAVVGLLGFGDMLAGAEQLYLADLRDALEKRDQALAQSRRNLQLAERVIDSSLEGIIITDARTRIEFVNPAFTHMTGYSLEEALGRTPAMLSSGRHDATFYRHMWDDLQARGSWRGEIWNRRKSGQLYLELLTITAIRDDDGQITHFAALFNDITHLRENEERVRRLAYYDALTQLPNRRLLEDRLSLAIRHAHRQTQRLAVIFIDLDHFKQVNDSLGHAAGDELLMQVARRLSAHLREDDSLARLGGDEFIALLPEIDTPEEAACVARRLIEAIRAPFRFGNREFRVGCSLGISLYPDDDTSVEGLLHHADAAMYRAKQEGRNTYRLFRADMHAHDDRRLALESALRETLETGAGLDVHYQPLFDRDTGRLCSAEALMRWRHPAFGDLSPTEFIPLAERSGLILPLGEYLLHRVVEQLRVWRSAGFDPVPVAVNLSARQFWQRDLVDWVCAELEAQEVPAELLGFELTESTLFDKQQQASQILRELRELGCTVAIDDFGTGYSSLSYLQELPISTLKIDRRFIQSLTDGGRGGQAILAAVTGLASELGLQVVAEGVETQAQLIALERFPVHRIQGFLTGHPVAAATFADNWLIGR